ncbi:MAG: GNAT family N-acetyltransferase [Saprospiraceae bacterium]|nr:GNAT family N-acetyltransferase [Saprospiraceae bacterium]
MTITFKCVHFSALTVYELYSVMALRQEVFIIEQNCPYLDADGRDLEGFHLLGYADLAENAQNTDLSRDYREGVSERSKTLVAYTRLLPKGVAYADYASIGRVVNSPKVRGFGIGKILMTQSIHQMARLFPQDAVKIGAQSYLLRFYESLGFESTGEEYLEDDIPHTSMILNLHHTKTVHYSNK